MFDIKGKAPSPSAEGIAVDAILLGSGMLPQSWYAELFPIPTQNTDWYRVRVSEMYQRVAQIRAEVAALGAESKSITDFIFSVSLAHHFPTEQAGAIKV